MAKQIQAETLREWLESQQPVTVLDIRTNEDRAQWAIPGSVHVNAYEALREGRSGALTDAAFPSDRPVVTVCNAGRVSETAAEILADRGFDARTLAGGMKAWSLAWNLADVPLSDVSVHVIQVRRTGKGCLSYVVGYGGQAAVIDPSVSSEVYVAIAKKRGWSVRYLRDPRPCGPLVARSGTRQADRCDVAVAGATARQVPFSDDRRRRRRFVGRRQHHRDAHARSHE